MAESPSPLDIAKSAREALRRIREAALIGRIRPNEMQEQSKEVLERFARALLQRVNKPNLPLREEHRSMDNIQHLNDYIAQLHTDLEGIKLTGNPLTTADVQMYIDFLSGVKSVNKFKHSKESEKPLVAVGVLSTGALALALISYLHEVPVFVAAAGKDVQPGEERKVIIPDLPEGEVTIIDDVVGQQATAINRHLRGQNRQTMASDLMGRKS